MLRHLPPTAAPLPFAALMRGLTPSGRSVEQFGDSLASYFDVPGCFLAASGRTALFWLLKALQERPENSARTEVVMPAYTCPSLAKVILDAGFTPRLVDIVPTTLQYDESSLTQATSSHTLAILCVHPFGIPLSIEYAQQVAHDAGAVVIEDAAQSMGAKIGNRYVGTIGDYGLFSLGPGKPLSTGGGGIVCVRDPEDAARLDTFWQNLPAARMTASLIAFARLTAFATAFHPTGWWLATKVGAHHAGDDEANWGYKVHNLTPVQAEIGNRLLPRLEVANRLRREHAEQVIGKLSGSTDLHVPQDEQAAKLAIEPIYLRLPILCASETLREQHYGRLWSAGIGVGRMYKKTMSEFFPKLAQMEYPGAMTVARQLLTVPTHHYLTYADIDRMVALLQETSVPTAGTSTLARV